MNKKIAIATTLTLVITFALVANTAVGIRFRPIERVSHVELTEITTFDEGCSGWKFFSVPFEASVYTKDIKITYQGTIMTLQDSFDRGILHKYIYVFDNENKNWNYFDQFETGRVYLAYSHVSDDITISAVGTFDDSDEPIELFQGLNYIGITTQSTIPLSNLRFSCETEGLDDMSFEDACSVLIDSHIFYATNTDEPVYELFSGDVLVPGDVYLIYALADGVMMSYVPTL